MAITGLHSPGLIELQLLKRLGLKCQSTRFQTKQSKAGMMRWKKLAKVEMI